MENTGKSIRPAESHVFIKPQESHQLDILFNNTNRCSLRYDLDTHSGFVTRCGKYTAPNRQGNFTVRISCAEDNSIDTEVCFVVRE